MVPGAAGSAAAADGGGAARWVPAPPVSSSPIGRRGRSGPGRRGPAGSERRPRTGASLQVLPRGRLPAPVPTGRLGSPTGCGRCGAGSPAPAGPPGCPPVWTRLRQPGRGGRRGEAPGPPGTPAHSAPPLLGSALRVPLAGGSGERHWAEAGPGAGCEPRGEGRRGPDPGVGGSV